MVQLFKTSTAGVLTWKPPVDTLEQTKGAALTATKELINPTDEQQLEIDKVLTWYNSGNTRPFWFAGAAGTGKSSCLPVIIDQLGIEGRYEICAPSNKAVGVLRQKGFENATTVAKIARQARVSGPKAGEFKALCKKLDVEKKAKNKSAVKQIFKDLSELRTSGDVYWTNVARNNGKMELIVVDEASMLGMQDLSALMATQSPILLIGDKNQLPAVNEKSAIAGKEPHAELKTILRQTGPGSILTAAAECLRNPRYNFEDYSFGETVTNGEQSVTKVSKDEFLPADQYLAYTNSQCFRHIEKAREGKPTTPIKGDRLLAYSNEGDIVKSQIYKVLSCEEDGLGFLSVVLEDETGEITVPIATSCPKNVFNKSLSDKGRLEMLGQSAQDSSAPGITEINTFYYADCITVHKSQGSEFDTIGFYLPVVNFYSKMSNEDLKRIKYTAITRAKEHLIVLV